MTTPSPEEHKATIAGLFDRLAPDYDNVGVDYFQVFAARLVDLVGLRPGEHVLDAGCGSGAATFAAVEAVGRDGRVTAIDISPAMVERTAADARERGLSWVGVRAGDAEAPDLGEGATFDAILSAFVIFFLPDPMAALRHYRALLPEGGRLGLTTFPPQPDTVWGRVAKAIEKHLPGAPSRPDQGPLASPEALVASLREAGFADVEQVTEPYDATFRDLDQWWRWAWSQGQRAALERIPADHLERFREHCYGILREVVAPDGFVTLRQRVTYTVATA
jgi:ubiquinone/menaquinone biosynthesis C-methylase UbiE